MSSLSYTIGFVGDSGVGKTAFIGRHKTGDFIRQYLPTKNVQETTLDLPSNRGPIQLLIKDFPGSDDCSLLSDCHAIVIVFDVTNVSSHNNIPKWYTLVRSILPNVPVVLCGNKADCKYKDVQCIKDRDITVHKTLNLQYYDISARSNYNFEKPFLYLMRQLYGDPDLVFTE